jgi:hypothetical protein
MEDAQGILDGNEGGLGGGIFCQCSGDRGRGHGGIELCTLRRRGVPEAGERTEWH